MTEKTFQLDSAKPIQRALWARGFAARGRTFRGGILGTIAEAPLGKGHGNDGKPFDPQTACYTIPIFESINRRDKRKVVIMSGVKTLKSFIVEGAAVDHVCNGTGDVGIFFGSGEVADDVSSTRILSFFEGVPLFQEKMRTITGQYDYTLGAVKFPDKTLWIKPANLANAQQKNLCFLGVQDAFVCGDNGMIDQLIERTTQYPNEKKIVLESQGGEKGFDFDRHYEDTNQAELHVLCPYCESKHIFNWRAWDMTRGEDFEAVLPRAVVESVQCSVFSEIPAEEPHRRLETENLKLETLRSELTAKLKSPDRRRCGFKRGADELIKFEDGRYNEAAVLRETHYECYHCGSRWDDTPEMREKLDRSSFYVASNPKALPENDGFSVAQWINRRLPWGNIMLQKLKRQKIYKETGNLEPLKQWWQKFAGRTWSDDIVREGQRAAYAVSVYETDPDKLAFGVDTFCRKMTVDCGKSPFAGPDEHLIGTLFFDIEDWHKNGQRLRQMSRGMVQDCDLKVDGVVRRFTAWELLAAQQRYWQVPAREVIIDGAWMPDQVINAALKAFELVKFADKKWVRCDEKDPLGIPRAWRLALGSPYKAVGPQKKPAYQATLPNTYPVTDRTGRSRVVRLFRVDWSNSVFEQQYQSIIDKGTSVEWEILAKEKVVIIGPDGKPNEELTRQYREYERDLPESNQFRAWESGMRSRVQDDKTKKWVDLNKRAAAGGHWTEPRDCGLMQLASAAVDGLVGHVDLGGDT